MVHFRKRFSAKTLQEINETICGVKSKKPRPKAIRRAIGKQLRYVKRDIKIITELLTMNPDDYLQSSVTN